MIVAGIDIETTGLDSHRDWIVEISVVTWDTVAGEAIGTEQTLVKPPTSDWELVLTDDGEFLNPDLKESHIKSFGLSYQNAAIWMQTTLEDRYPLVAHNVSFEQKFIKSMLEHYLMEMPDAEWIDTMKCLGRPYYERSLAKCAEYFETETKPAHRATEDVKAMLECAQKYGWDRVIQNHEENKRRKKK